MPYGGDVAIVSNMKEHERRMRLCEYPRAAERDVVVRKQGSTLPGGRTSSSETRADWEVVPHTLKPIQTRIPFDACSGTRPRDWHCMLALTAVQNHIVGHIQYRDVGCQNRIDSVWRAEAAHYFDPENVGVPGERHQQEVLLRLGSQPVDAHTGTN